LKGTSSNTSSLKIDGGGAKITVANGDITLGNYSRLGFNDVTASNITLSTGKIVGVADDATNAIVSFSGTTNVDFDKALAGALSLEVSNAGGVTLTGENTYTGSTTIDTGGTLTISGNGALGYSDGSDNNYAGAIEIGNGGTLTFSQTHTDDQNLSGVISGAGTLNANSATNKLTLSNDKNTYTGNISVDTGGTLDVTGSLGYSNVNGSETRNYTGDIDNAGTLTFNQSADQELSGTISGVGALIKSGSGVLKLAGDNSQFTGDFKINTGSVAVTGGSKLGSDKAQMVTVAGGATLEMFGDAIINKTVELSPSMTPGLIVYTEGNSKAHIEQVEAKKDASVLFVIDDLANYTTNNPVLEVESAFLGADETRFGAILTGNTDKSALVKNLYLINEKNATGFTNGADVTIWDGLVQYGAKVGSDGKVISTSVTARSIGQAKAVSEGYLGGIGLLNMGSDLLQEKGVANAVSRVGGRSAGEAFAALGGGSLKHKTGSHVDISGFSLVTGLAAGVGSGATVGGFIEYGDGDYDSHNGFSGPFGSGKVKGSGDVDYLGVGLLGRFDLPRSANGQPYLEATARFGRANNEFKAKDFGYEMRGARYDVKSDYYGLSFGGGHVWNLDAGSTVDFYGRYVWTHQEGDSTRLTWTGASGNAEEARVRFSDIDSHRVRIGTRYFRKWEGENRFYTGVAWEHEFDGKAAAKDAVRNVKIDDAPSLKGSTGIVEFGLVLYPSANKNLSIDLGVQGYGGKRQGVTGSAQLKYAF
ncbi:MAG: autotransporter domain-containing protein, partial [Candidatus Accumulibacter sp.]|nr:autotransporter domain-containing protein [Accumulibacter sp.]